MTKSVEGSADKVKTEEEKNLLAFVGLTTDPHLHCHCPAQGLG